MPDEINMCGILGIWSSIPFSKRVFVGWLRALRHRGQEAAGVVWSSETLSTWMSSASTLAFSSGTGGVDECVTSALGHARYSTSGIKEGGAQPLIAPSFTRGGKINAFVHNGNVVPFEDPGAKLSDSAAMWAWLLDTYKTNGSWEATLQTLISSHKGAFSIVIDTDDGVYVARDRYGVRPLWVAFDSPTTTYMVMSETCAIPDANGWKDVPPIQVRPGEIRCAVRNHEYEFNGCSWKRLWRFAKPVDHRFCSFEWIYLQHHTSSQVYGYRYELGEALALDEVSPVDPETAIVACMPRTAIPMAAGFADALGLTFCEGAIQKAPKSERTFILPSEDARREACKVKFVYSKPLLEGKDVFLVDDSLVRGTTIKATLDKLATLGVGKVHVRIASPPVANPCDKGIDIPTKTELAWSRVSYKDKDDDKDKEEILASSLGCASLRYLPVERLKAVIGSKVCTYCFTGEQAWSDAF